jgi:hypothetical protein
VNPPKPKQRYCKTCHAAYMRERAARQGTWYPPPMIRVALTPEQIRERRRRYLQKRRKNNPDKSRAWSLANDEVRAGKLAKQPCEVCGATNAHKHHADYSKPLEIRWLCRKHRLELHRGTL